MKLCRTAHPTWLGPAFLLALLNFVACSSEQGTLSRSPEATRPSARPASSLTIAWDEAGTSTVGRPGHTPIALRLASFGRGDLAVPAESIPPSRRFSEQLNRTELAREGLVEWWTRSGTSIEQGFDVTARPPGTGPLEIALEVEGATATVRSDYALIGPFAYSKLISWDRAGTPLDARMVQRPNGLALVIDDEDADYPITVDPILTAVDWTAASGQDGANMGQSVAGVGDINGDGFDDAAFGAPGWSVSGPSSGEGAVLLFFGGPTGLPAVPSLVVPGTVPGQGLGRSVAGAGDVNGDGLDDLLIGGVSLNSAVPAFTTGYFSDGVVQLHLGAPAGPATTPDWTYSGGSSEGCGWRLDGAGDLNGDAVADFVISCVGAGSTEGRVEVFYGAPSLPGAQPDWSWTGVANSSLGGSVAGLGDVNGDGYSDIGVGSSGWDQSPTTPTYVLNGGLIAILFGGPGGLPPVSDPSTDLPWLVFGAPDGVTPQAHGDFGLVAGAGDVDGDGYSDVLVAASRWDGAVASDEGSAWLLPGGPTGPSSTASWSVQGEGLNLYLGTAASSAGDVNGDGFADVVVGRPRYSGSAYLFLGGPQGLPPGGLAAGTALPGPSNVGSFAAALGTADVDGDGDSDLLIGSSLDAGSGTGQGAGFVYLGSARGLDATASWTLAGSPLDLTGAGLAWLGDINGDGFGDAAIGAPDWSGAAAGEGVVWLHLGGPTGLSTSPSSQLVGGQAGAGFGTALAAADFDGDGFADLAVSASGWDAGSTPDVGAVAWYAGSPAGLSSSPSLFLEGDESGADYGASLAVGDVNGDGHPDLAIGAPSRNTSRGRVTGHLGSPAGPLFSSPDWILDGALPGSLFGTAVGLSADLHDDGFADLVVGEPGLTAGQSNEGRVSVFAGGPDGPSVTATWSTDGNQTGAMLGASVAGVDVDGDGWADLAVGAPGWTNGETGEGQVQVFPGGPTLATAPAWTVESNQVDAAYGTTLATLGDTDGDGFGDLLIGAPGWDSTLPDVGAAFVHVGSVAGPEPTPTALLEGPGGGSVSVARGGPADQDGDGLDDVLIAFPGASVASVHRGDGVDGARALGLVPRLVAGGTSVALFPGARSPTATVTVEAFAKPFWGRSPVRLEVEAKPMGVPFDGLGTIVGSWTDSNLSGALVSASLTLTGDGTPYAVRTRLQLDPDSRSPLRATRWIAMGTAGDAQGIAVRAPCAGDLDLDGACDSYDPDADGDGEPAASDCDDFDADLYPGALDTADDGIDQDCSGSDTVTCFVDGDGDGVGASATLDPDGSCLEAGQAPSPGDCDDADAQNSPLLPEVCDGQDNNCDGASDEGFDGDGDGSPSCLDCDDADAGNTPGAPELCDGADNDCSGAADLDGLGEIDADGDGVLSCEDCDEANPNTFPGAPEICDGEDNSCDGVTLGEGDADGDGSLACADCDDQDPLNSPDFVELCDGQDNDCDATFTDEFADIDGDGQTPCSGDCDDESPDVFSGAVEICDGVDNDCDPGTNESLDGDGDGRSLCFGDCDDTNPNTYGGAPEICDGEDNDCDGPPNFDGGDELDVDEDGVRGCDGDCDDEDPLNTPGGTELCDGADNDCDGSPLDEEEDEDGDGLSPCEGDCDDQDAEISPSADEICNGLDDDCNEDVDEGFDLDGDGATSCDGDCDDQDPAIGPDATEVPDDGVDQDCSGADTATCYSDLDGDGYAGANTALDPDGECDDDPGQSSLSEDCDDFDATANPGLQEDDATSCRDNRDNDCDGLVDALDPECEAALSPELAPGCDASCAAVAGSPAPGTLFVLLLLLWGRARGRVRARSGAIVVSLLACGLALPAAAAEPAGEVLVIGPRKDIATNSARASLSPGAPFDPVAFPEASKLAGVWVMGAAMADSCPTPTVTMAEVRTSLDQAKSQVDKVKLGEARALLSSLRSRLGCLREVADAEALWRLHFLEAVANWWDADPEAAADSLERALGIRPGQAYDPTYPPDLGEVYLEAQVRVREPGWALLVSPAISAGEPGEVLVDGRPTPPTGLSLLGGEHLIQVRGADGSLRGARLVLEGGSTVVVAEPGRAHEAIEWLDLTQQRTLAKGLWKQLADSPGSRAWLVDDKGTIKALGESPPPRTVTLSGRSRAGHPSVSLRVGGGLARYGGWTYGAIDVGVSVRLIGPLRLDIALTPHLAAPVRSDWDGALHVAVLPLLSLGPTVRIPGPVRPRFGAALQLAGDSNSDGDPKALVGVVGIAAVELPAGRSAVSVEPWVCGGFFGRHGTVRGGVSLAVAL